MCIVLHAIVAAALPLLAGSSAPAARQEPGPRRAWLCRVGAGWGRPIGAERSQMPIFGTISIGLQPSGSSSQPSPRRFQTSSLRRPPVGPPHRWPRAQLSNEGLQRLSCTSFPTPLSPSRFPTSQVRLPRLGARACMGSMAGWGPGGIRSVGRAWDAPPGEFYRVDHAVCRYRLSSRAGLCADASEPERDDLCKDRHNDGPQVEVPDADATHVVMCHPRGACPATHAMRACRHAARRWQHSNGRDCLDR